MSSVGAAQEEGGSEGSELAPLISVHGSVVTQGEPRESSESAGPQSGFTESDPWAGTGPFVSYFVTNPRRCGRGYNARVFLSKIVAAFEDGRQPV